MHGKNLFRVLEVVAIGTSLNLAGCATLTASKDAVVTRTIDTKTERIDNKGDLVVSDSAWHGATFSAVVKREVLCRTETRRLVESQPVKRRTTDTAGMVIDGVGGAVLGLGALSAFVAAPFLSTEPRIDSETGEQLATDQTGAIALGVVALLGSGYLLWLVFDGATGAKDVNNGPAEKEWNTDPGKEAVCEQVDPGRGAIEFVYAGGGSYRQRVDTGHVVLDVSATADVFCSMESDLGKKLAIYFTDPTDRVRAKLTEYDADTCILETVSRKDLEQSEQLIASKPQFDQVRQSIELIEKANKNISQLPEGGAVRSELEAIAERLRARNAEVARSLVDESVVRFAQVAAKKDVGAVIDGAQVALALSRNVPEKRLEVWSKIYTTLASTSAARGVEGPAIIKAVFEYDSETKACLANDGDCPEWLPRERALTALEVSCDAFCGIAKKAKQGVDKLAQTVAKKPTLPAATSLGAEIAHGDTVIGQCETLSWHDATRSACGELQESTAAGRAALEKARPILDKQRQAATLTQWKRYFARCKPVVAGIEQLNREGCNTVQCATIRQKLETDYQELRTFKIEDGWADEPHLAALRQECAESRCPVCP